MCEVKKGSGAYIEAALKPLVLEWGEPAAEGFTECLACFASLFAAKADPTG